MAVYPTAAAADSDLFIAVNSLATTLNGGINNAVTTIVVTSTTGFPTVGYISIDSEIIKYTGTSGGTSFTGCTRASDGTAAASHSNGAVVGHYVIAAHHNVLKDEIKAIEADLVASYVGGSTSIATTFAKYLKLVGGTMSGAIAMGASKITGLAAATANGDAIRFEQVGLNAAGYIIGTQPQYVQGTQTATVTTTSNTYVTTNLTATITPKATTHTIRVTVSGAIQNPSGSSLFVTLKRGSTDLDATGNGFAAIGSGTASLVSDIGFTFMDTPATVSATTYTVHFRSNAGATCTWNPNTFTSVILLQEVAA